MKIRESLINSSDQILDFINGNYSVLESDKKRIYYGCFFILALSDLKNNKSKIFGNLIKGISELRQDSNEFHWEFNKFAVTFFKDITLNEPKISEIANSNRYNNSKATNWRLLNTLVKLKRGEIKEFSLKGKLRLSIRQEFSGFIRDAYSVRSAQYHAFSTALLWDIYIETKDPYVLKKFFKAVNCLNYMVLDSGNFNYLGRGQMQSFGFGPAIYSLLAAYSETNDSIYMLKAEKLMGFVKEKQRKDGSLQLVLTDGNSLVYSDYRSDSKDHLGWYPYNNYLDYLAFLGFYLHRSAMLLSCDKCTNRGLKGYSPIKLSFKMEVIKTIRYEAVISAPYGYWTNGLPVPYIEVKGVPVTPVLGGEQFQQSFYKPYMNSMPTLEDNELKVIYSFIVKQRLFVLTRNGLLIRSFKFLDRTVLIKSYNLLFGKIVDNYSFIGEWGVGVEGVSFLKKGFKILISGDNHQFVDGYSASGQFNVVRFFDKRIFRKISIHIGDS